MDLNIDTSETFFRTESTVWRCFLLKTYINAQFEGQLTEDDKVIMEMVGKKLVDKPTEQQRSLARNNSWEMFRDSLFKKEFINEMIHMSSESRC